MDAYLRLVHRLSFFSALSPQSPEQYGFSCGQAAFDPFVPGNTEAVVAWVNGLGNNLQLLLAFTPGPTNALFGGATLPASWYDTFRAGMGELLNRLGARVVGLRWNHEHRSSEFAPTPEWENWLAQKNYPMLQYVLRYQRTAWLKLLEDTKSLIHPVQFLERTTGTPYDGPSWTDFRTTFRLWCQFQCQREAVVINRLADIAGQFGLPCYLYPGGRNARYSPRLLPELEYTLDQALVSKSIILEAGGWNTMPADWINEVSASISQPFIWTNQIGSGLLEADAPAEFSRRLQSKNSLGQSPQGIGFWCDWTADFVRQTPFCQSYMNGVRATLI